MKKRSKKKAAKKKAKATKEPKDILVEWVCKTCGYRDPSKDGGVAIKFGNVHLQHLCENCFGHWWEKVVAGVPRMVVEPVKK